MGQVGITEGSTSKLILQDRAEEATMDCQPAAVVVDKAEFPEPIHEVTDPGPGGADHFRQGLLIDVGNHRIELPVGAIMIQRQQDPGQALLAEIEEASHEIFFGSNHTRKKIGD